MKNSKTKLEILFNDIKRYEKRDMKKNVEDRLNKTLKLYVNDLQRSYERLKDSKHEILK